MEPEKDNETKSEKVTLSIQDTNGETAAYHCGMYDGYRKALFDMAQITLIIIGVLFIVEYNRR